MGAGGRDEEALDSTGLEVFIEAEGNGLPGDTFSPYRPASPVPRKSIRERWEQSIKDNASKDFDDLIAAAKEAISDRHKKNDIPERNFERIAKVWSALLNIDITPEQVALMMIGLKVVREAFTHQNDNLVDIVGYALCLEEITNAADTKETVSQKDPGQARCQSPYL